MWAPLEMHTLLVWKPQGQAMLEGLPTPLGARVRERVCRCMFSKPKNWPDQYQVIVGRLVVFMFV